MQKPFTKVNLNQCKSLAPLRTYKDEGSFLHTSTNFRPLTHSQNNLTMETTLSSLPLTSLTSWSMQHIHDIFEASSDDESLRALDKTFTKDVEATVNGNSIQYRDIQGMVLGLRKDSSSRLRVSWQQVHELPQDPSTNRVWLFRNRR